MERIARQLVAGFAVVVIAPISSTSLAFAQTSAQTSREPIDHLVHWETNSFTDKVTGVMFTTAKRIAVETLLLPHRLPAIRTKAAYIQVVCRGNDLNMYIAVDGELVAGHRTEVDYRLDGTSPVHSGAWASSTDNTAIGLWGRLKSSATINTFAKAKKLIFRSTHDVFGVMQVEVNLVGMEAGLKDIRHQCSLPAR